MPRAFLLQEFVVTVCLVLAYQAIISSAFADPIRVLVSNWPPLVFVDQNGQIAGSFIDRLKAGETSTGLKFIYAI